MCSKPQMRSGTHRDLKFWSKMRCLACKNHRWGLGHIETSISGANHSILQAHNDRLCLGLIETCFSGPKVALLHPKTTHEGWDPWRLVILMLLTLHCRHKTAGEIWDQYNLLFGSKSRCFACKKHRWGLGHIGTSDSGANHAVFHAQNDRLCLGLTETCYSGPKVAALHPKTTHEYWDQ